MEPDGLRATGDTGLDVRLEVPAGASTDRGQVRLHERPRDAGRTDELDGCVHPELGPSVPERSDLPGVGGTGDETRHAVAEAVVRTNAAAEVFLAATDERNAVRLTYAGAWRDLIDNWDDIAWVGLARLQAEAARLPQDEVLAELVDLATRAVGDLPRPAAGVSGPVPLEKINEALRRHAYGTMASSSEADRGETAGQSSDCTPARS